LSKGLPVIAALAGTRGRLHTRHDRGDAEGADPQRADAARAERSWRNSVVHAVVGRFSFGSDVDPGLVADVEGMIAATGLETLAAFAPTFLDHDKLAAVPALGGIPTVILVGEDDLMTPVQHSRALAEALPDAELRVLSATGHMLILERPAEIEVALRRLLDRSRAAIRPPELPRRP
jgi:pimeloyl-ACP methyl ester carboxylesterase